MNPLRLLRAVLDFAGSPSASTGLALFEVVLEETASFLPVDALKGSLDAAARKRGEAVADVLEDVKFGP